MKRSSRVAAVASKALQEATSVAAKFKKSKASEISKSVTSKKTNTKAPANKPSLKGKSKDDESATSKRTKKGPAVEEHDDVSPYFANITSPTTVVPTFQSGSKLPRSFYDRDCIDLSKALLGKVLVRRLPETGEILRGTIVETEAYPGGEDKASQSYQGKRTPRNEAMFLDPGTAYVYFTYGMYYCFNISSRGEGAACLLRAVEPLEDYETMHTLRKPPKKKNATTNESEKPKKRLNSYELANGPSKLCLAFGIKRDNCDKIDMTSSDELWLENSENPVYKNVQFIVESAKRIGIDSTPPDARDKLWRFYIKDSLAESRAKISEIKKRLGK